MRKLLTAIAILSLVLFAACSGNDASNPAVTASVETTTAATASTDTMAVTDTAGEAEKIAKQKADSAEEVRQRAMTEIKEQLAILDLPAPKPSAFLAKVKNVDQSSVSACETQTRYDAAARLEQLSKQYPEVAKQMEISEDKVNAYLKNASLDSAKAFLSLAKSGKQLACENAGLYNGKNSLKELRIVRLVEEAIDRAAIADVSESGKELGMSPQAVNMLLATTFKNAAPALSEILSKYDPSSSEVPDNGEAHVAGCAIWSAVNEYGIPAKDIGITEEVMRKAESLHDQQG